MPMQCSGGVCYRVPQAQALNIGANMAPPAKKPTPNPKLLDYLSLLSPAVAVGNLARGKSNIGGALQSAGITSTPGRNEQVPLYTPQQQQAIMQFLGSGLQGLGALGQLGQQQFRVPSSSIQNLFNQTLAGSQGPNLSFEPIEAHARRQFQTQTIPSIAERFTSLGGGQRSSAFQGALGSAASDLESQLGALRANYGLQAGQLQNRNQLLRQSLLNQLMGSQAQQFGQQGQLFQNLAQLGLTSPFQNQYHPQIPGLLQNLSGQVGQALPALAGLFL